MNIQTFDFVANVRFLDTDKYGHVNNSVYFTYFEEARTEWLYKIENLINWAEDNSVQFVIAEQSCKYILPLHHPNKIQIKQYISRIGPVSIEFYYELRLLGSDIILTTAKSKLALFNSTTGRLHKLPSKLKQQIESLNNE
jgi:acyl-CoA thioester hydrolase